MWAGHGDTSTDVPGEQTGTEYVDQEDPNDSLCSVIIQFMSRVAL